MATTAQKKKSPRKTSTSVRSAPLPVVMISIDKIHPSPLNRDATVNLASLVDSIKEHGLQEAIKLRPSSNGYEIVYGERRWRAFKKLGYSEIPATVEQLTDDAAHQLRIVENAQRSDPHALEEAESFERLLAMKDAKGQPLHTPEDVAKTAGCSIGHVYNRLKLTALAPELRKALYKNELTLTSAFLVARGIPTALQADAWKKMQAYADEAYEEEIDDDGRLTSKTVQNIIDHDYSSRLDSAAFSLKDGKLIPTAGSCQACAKRSGNQPQLFADADRKDVCTDLPCFQQKIAAYVAREKEHVLAVGGKVLTEDESRRVFNGGASLPFNSKWIDLDSACFDDPSRRTWRKLLGDLCPPPTLAFTSQAKPVLLADKAAILATLKAHGLDPESLRAKTAPAKKKASAGSQNAPAAAGPARPEHPDDPDDDLEEDLEPDDDPAHGGATTSADPRFAADVARLSRQRIIAAVVAAAEAAAGDDNRFVQLVYETTLHGGYHNAILDAVKRRLGTKRPKGEHPTESLQAHALGLTPAALRALVLELAISRSAYYVTGENKYPRDLARAIELYRIDAKAIEKTVSDELGSKRAARLAKAQPGSA